MTREAASRPPPPTAGQAHQTASKLPLPASPAAPWEPGPEAGKSVLHPKKTGLSLGAIPPSAPSTLPSVSETISRGKEKGGA